MVYKVYSGRVGGVFGDLITVEVDASPGLPGMEIIGLPGSDVREAKDRVRVALKNCGITLPALKLVVNLSPADEHKEGAGFDLAIAAALLGVTGHIMSFVPEEALVVGALSLDGKILPARGVLPIAKFAAEHGFKRILVPKVNASEAALIKGIDVIALEGLNDFIRLANTDPASFDSAFPPYISEYNVDDALNNSDDLPDFSEVAGQESVKRAAVVAAAGMHHFMMIGPPGTGKSLVAKRIPGILPPLTYEESLEVTSVYSIAGKLDGKLPFMCKRPFFGPHHTASPQAIVGGGPGAKPGLVSLSHRGVLFLDEMTEFKKETLDMLRQPLEDGEITVSRARKTYTYPAKFMLVAAMNPCPCGYFPDRNRCLCTDAQISRYLSKISGPIADRIDICTEVSRMEPRQIDSGTGGMSSEELRAGVLAAIKRQNLRYSNESFKYNSLLPSSRIEEYIPLSDKEKEYAYGLYDSLKLSTRSFYKLLRVARTIADLDGEEKVTTKQLAEASCYRFPEYMGG
ncbi:MAG: YifB family Mg chelatase-like AAA ATPase [Lachnospiraceae bacterium]|nr:YifB family Mg chelatase-like AAA ATPase [Lachnospiraceae bacterium]